MNFIKKIQLVVNQIASYFIKKAGPEHIYDKVLKLNTLYFINLEDNSFKSVNGFIGCNYVKQNKKELCQVTLRIVLFQHDPVNRLEERILYARDYFTKKKMVNVGDVMNKLLKGVKQELLKDTSLTHMEKSIIRSLEIDCSDFEQPLLASVFASPYSK